MGGSLHRLRYKYIKRMLGARPLLVVGPARINFLQKLNRCDSRTQQTNACELLWSPGTGTTPSGQLLSALPEGGLEAGRWRAAHPSRDVQHIHFVRLVFVLEDPRVRQKLPEQEWGG